MTQLQLAYLVAKTQLGVAEVLGAEHNQKIIEYHAACTLKATDDETPWCSSFINWCYIIAGLICNFSDMKMLLKAAKYSDAHIDLFSNSANDIFKQINGERYVYKFAPQLPTRSAMARSWLIHGVNTKKPNVGDLVVFSRGNSRISGHVAFYEGRDLFTVNCFGGNQSNMVCQMQYQRPKVIAYIKEEECLDLSALPL